MRRVLRIGATALLAAAVLAGLGLVVPALLGYERYVIVSGSMSPAFDRGALVFDEVVPVRELRVGDVITYRPPPGSGPAGLVTHRIAEIAPDGRFRTKGDANATVDPWTFRLTAERQARVVADVPYAGHVLSALSDRRVRMLVIGLPAALIAVATLAGLWRESAPDGSPA
jgi:signal peptidase